MGLLTLLFGCLLLSYVTCGGTQPEQVHLSLTGNLNEMFVTWVTLSPVPATPFVKYGSSQYTLDRTVIGVASHFSDGGDQKIVRYVYRAKMRNLQPETEYFYKVGSTLGYSQIFSFKTFPSSNAPVRVCIFGDMGFEGGQFDDLINGVNKYYDMVIHIGDIAYDLDGKNGNTGDDFMRKIEPVASKIPYMVIPGNHEKWNNYNHYKHRFTMPDNGTPRKEGFFYSFDVGFVHFVGITNEFYAQKWTDYAQEQFHWLEQDLKKTQKPWIISLQHRPMYCSNDRGNNDCENEDNKAIRNGASGLPGLETPLSKNGVDLSFFGHMHSYERMWPVFRDKVYRDNQSIDSQHNVMTPIHIVSGSGGTTHSPHTHQDDREDYSAIRSEAFGFTIVHVENATTLHMRQFATELRKDVDTLTLTKGPGYRPGKNLPY
ncbi:hypothetical protein L596_026165 [Steinernema carpocapsae]|uniref:Purple acid phosphatase n=1 Tax=Steinernema carpocapsae TaxID=34508 RepID=A0A4U5M0J9_STECR|nr:hypothetical protein L596_026165 [Steinernema carpocapsae]